MARVVPGHVVVEVGAGDLESVEDSRVVGAVFHRSELGLRVGIVIATVGPVMGLSDVARFEKFGQRVGAHGGARVGVDALGHSVVTEYGLEHLAGEVIALALLDSEADDLV